MNTSPWNTAEMLDVPEVIAAYLELSMKEDTPDEFQRSLETIARAKGMTALAKETGLTRQNLYRTLAPTSNPTIHTLWKILAALDLTLTLRSKSGI